jgi:hypothetical protein
MIYLRISNGFNLFNRLFAINFWEIYEFYNNKKNVAKVEGAKNCVFLNKIKI